MSLAHTMDLQADGQTAICHLSGATDRGIRLSHVATGMYNLSKIFISPDISLNYRKQLSGF